jgi:hypothetical protein
VYRQRCSELSGPSAGMTLRWLFADNLFLSLESQNEPF